MQKLHVYMREYTGVHATHCDCVYIYHALSMYVLHMCVVSVRIGCWSVEDSLESTEARPQHTR